MHSHAAAWEHPGKWQMPAQVLEAMLQCRDLRVLLAQDCSLAWPWCGQPPCGQSLALRLLCPTVPPSLSLCLPNERLLLTKRGAQALAQGPALTLLCTSEFFWHRSHEKTVRADYRVSTQRARQVSPDQAQPKERGTATCSRWKEGFPRAELV